MKPKTFVEPRWIAAIIFGVFFCGLGGFIAISYVVVMIMHYTEDISVIPMCMFAIAMGVSSIGAYIGFLLPKSFSLLTVSSTKIVWRCPFYRSVKLKIEDCIYVSVEDMAEHNIAMPVIRGDEIAYIYLGNVPFPEKYKHKADAMRRKKGMITFAYSDALCEKLMAVLPEEKTRGLASFYNRMQAADKINQIKQQQAKRRKNKKK